MFNKLQQNLISQPSLLQTLRTYATAQVVKFSEFGSATSQLKYLQTLLSLQIQLFDNTLY